MPKVSVIIPCFNQGEYVDEAVDSVCAQTFQNFEIIIVNDGSTDNFTNEKLKSYIKPKTKVIQTTNQGLSEARNIGIKQASGEFILPLDADDKIGEKYLQKAINIFERHPATKLVYCGAEFFGEESGKWEMQAYNYKRLLVNNLIFCTAMYRKSDYLLTTGYNANMEFGWEDWDFWLNLLKEKDIVHKIPDTLFYYRKKAASMISSMDEDKRHFGYKSIYFNNYEKYYKLYGSPQNMISKMETLNDSVQDLNNQVLSIRNSKSYKLAKFLSNAVHLLRKK